MTTRQAFYYAHRLMRQTIRHFEKYHDHGVEFYGPLFCMKIAPQKDAPIFLALWGEFGRALLPSAMMRLGINSH